MEPILGIDLGTTNSVVSIIQNNRPVDLKDATGQAILPSVVGFDAQGRLLVGAEARNQLLVAPERTVKSIKRLMGQTTKVRLGDTQYSPEEISAMILKALKNRAEQALGRPVTKAVITVPAFFKENQRQATHEAGVLAGLEVVRIINEPTAAALTYNPVNTRRETLLVYDLGGGTFDVSIVQMEGSVVEVLASHGDTQLGGDDFDLLLLNHICDQIQAEQGIDLRSLPAARSRMLQAAEEAKKRLSFEPFTRITEEFVAEHQGRPVHVDLEIQRGTYESLIDKLAHQTLTSVDAALADAKLSAVQLDRVLLVGGSTRTPLIQELLRKQLGHEPRWEVDPDLCVSLGAAIQGGLTAGLDVGPVLIDITAHTLGVRCTGYLHGRRSDRCFSPIIRRNTPLPATRSEVYYTEVDGQEQVRISVHQGEHEDALCNQMIGEFTLDGLDQEAESGSPIVVQFDLNLNGMLRVRAAEKRTGKEQQIVIESSVQRTRASNRDQSQSRLETAFSSLPTSGFRIETVATGQIEEEVAMAANGGSVSADEKFATLTGLISKAQSLIPRASPQDAQELKALLEELRTAVGAEDEQQCLSLQTKLEDLMFYLADVEV